MDAAEKRKKLETELRQLERKVEEYKRRGQEDRREKKRLEGRRGDAFATLKQRIEWEKEVQAHDAAIQKHNKEWDAAEKRIKQIKADLAKLPKQ